MNPMTDLPALLADTIDGIRKHYTGSPAAGIILGTGLGNFAEKIKAECILPYEKIPHFPVSTVEGHHGRLIFGTIDEIPVVAMQGRFHAYEAYHMRRIVYPVMTMHALGVRKLIVSNAAGGLHPGFRIGDMMIITDHINLMNANPLTGPNDDRLGPRFPDMSKPYCKPAVETALRLAGEEGVRCQTGIYAAVKGPCFETPAECRFIRLIGADAIGMSTIPEVIAANHLGMEVFAFSVITDLAIEGQMSEVSHEEVLKAAQNAEPGVSRVVRRLLRDWCSSPS